MVSIAAFQAVDPGSNPGHGSDILLVTPSTNFDAILSVHKSSSERVSVSGIVVSIAAFQAVDPGSIPGRRKLFSFFFPPFKIQV